MGSTLEGRERGQFPNCDRRGRSPACTPADRGPAAPCYELTTRELAVLTLIAQGLADKEIGRELSLSLYTINKHVHAILLKMHVSSRTAAAVRALREGLLDLDEDASPDADSAAS